MKKLGANALLAVALRLDRAGREPEAIPLYRQAIRAGLKGILLRDAMVCLGSSLTAVGHHRAAVRILKQSIQKFPADPVPALFLSLALHQARNPVAAVRTLAEHLIAHPHSKSFAPFKPVLHRKFRGLRSPSSK